MGSSQGHLGSATSNIEKILEETHIPMFQMMGLSLSQAKESFSKMLNECKEQGQREGTANLPENWGDIVLQREAGDEKVRNSLAKLRREGVTDQDIRNWWNQPDLARWCGQILGALR